MSKAIPAGYSLHILSWENDADCYKTQVFNGLTDHDVEFLIDIAKLFRSMHSRPAGFGGGGWHYKGGEAQWKEDIYDAIDAVVAKHESKDVNPKLLADAKVDRTEEYYEDGYSEIITELLGYPETDMYQGGSYIRVFDSFTVYHYETPVEDVTKAFK